ncbi:4'-phosphopantetheinyl transferase superfamily protein [Amphritea opalescens]|uniref:4'-phosphopantetheinyl transferase superfamily protein n=1 Tax=Amphritea opalescens TaxID=2490544 RepID=A0A430KR08_9GAMM|nr:4'-phosphopantetheinyl transferase superfamily protein [Amphritea opalescens]RTE65949.1 4'-phosphopantetheinyl transferase superfamily protein [Amphritea opalescens]
MPANGKNGALQLWYYKTAAHHDKETQQYLALLPPAQQRYYKQLQHPRRAQQYLFSRLLICSALSERFNQPLSRWQIEERRHCAPVIHNLPLHGYISLTHSKALIGFALSDNNVGIDLEYKKRTRDFTSAAGLFMSPNEICAMPTSTAAKEAYFYRLWCAKEALYKALPATQQSKTSLATLSYQDLKMANTQWQLFEATMDNHQLAVVSSQVINAESLHINELKFNV